MVLFQEFARFFQVESVSVDGQLIFPGIFWDVNDTLDAMAALTESLNEKIDIYHVSKFTAGWA
ncbi:MAG TPA: hypothetical protein VNU92_17425 [Edaphobacter sp.]|nr:hypothetical protein [Edaphobacter sp.]